MRAAIKLHASEEHNTFARTTVDAREVLIRPNGHAGGAGSVGERAARSRAAQGLPPHVEDVTVLARVAALLTAGMDKPSVRPASVTTVRGA